MLVRLTKDDGRPYYVEALKITDLWEQKDGKTYVSDVGLVNETPELSAKIINAGKALSYGTPQQHEAMVRTIMEDGGLLAALPFAVALGAAFASS